MGMSGGNQSDLGKPEQTKQSQFAQSAQMKSDYQGNDKFAQ